MPDPESDNVVGELAASLMSETLPVTEPAAEGLKVTLAEVVRRGQWLPGR